MGDHRNFIDLCVIDINSAKGTIDFCFDNSATSFQYILLKCLTLSETAFLCILS